GRLRSVTWGFGRDRNPLKPWFQLAMDAIGKAAIHRTAVHETAPTERARRIGRNFRYTRSASALILVENNSGMRELLDNLLHRLEAIFDHQDDIDQDDIGPQCESP